MADSPIDRRGAHPDMAFGVVFRDSTKPAMTTDQLTIEEAIEAGHHGATLASEAAGLDWLDYATEFVRTYLEQHDELFCDDLWDAGLIEPVSPRALGAVMKHAARQRWMEPIPSNQFGIPGDVCRPSVRSRGQLKRVWRSLLR